MLGLGASLGRGGSVIESSTSEILVYQSDFTSGVDGFDTWNMPSGSTVAANQTIDGSSGWLKVTYGLTETGSGGTTKPLVLIPSGPAQSAQNWRMTGKLYFEEASSEWGGSVTSWRIGFAGKIVGSNNFGVNQTETFNLTNPSATDVFGTTRPFFTYGDGSLTTISQDAAFYLKDLEIYAVV